MCYYSSHTVVVTSSSLDIRVALSKLFYLYILFYMTPLFLLPYVNISMYTGKNRLRRGLFIFFFFFIIRLSSFTQSITVEHRKNTSAYNAPRTFGRLPLSRGQESCSSRLSQNSIRNRRNCDVRPCLAKSNSYKPNRRYSLADKTTIARSRSRIRE